MIKGVIGSNQIISVICNIALLNLTSRPSSHTTVLLAHKRTAIQPKTKILKTKEKENLSPKIEQKADRIQFRETLRNFIVENLNENEEVYDRVILNIYQTRQKIDAYYEEQNKKISEEFGRSNGHVPTPEDYLFSTQVYFKARSDLKKEVGEEVLNKIIKFIRDYHYQNDGVLPIVF